MKYAIITLFILSLIMLSGCNINTAPDKKEEISICKIDTECDNSEIKSLQHNLIPNYIEDKNIKYQNIKNF